ncbi:hypothetical protein [Paenibacillus glycanilyticus]|uniref:YtkA-like domain-containing protein n=1 Tax=Paenibacillus glycanilyticus TaxID=126569 RepID=A0ABQ6GF87_9BACL|nr:hypothetical protein [Paenibacillus glycanilyticus]GLX69631.1 hypothetical protein MU1_39760 [Paenibacillus glycanilyticus]
MKNLSACMMILILLFILVISGCSIVGEDRLFDIQISVQETTNSREKVRVALDINESVVSEESWVLFEIRNPESKGSAWLQTKYEGKGTFTAETDQLKGKYKLIGHFYANGGIHYSRVYKPG